MRLQKNAERQRVRDQQERYEEGRDPVGGSELPWHESRIEGLVKRVQEIAKAAGMSGDTTPGTRSANPR